MKAFMAFAVAALAIGLSPFAVAMTGAAPSPNTQTALACLLGMEPTGCETSFVGAAYSRDGRVLPQFAVRNLMTYCTGRYVRRRLDNCYSGPLERIEYLGANAAGADVYAVEYMNATKTYVISPPAADGKVPAFWILDSPVIRATPHWVAAVTSPANPTQTLYTRHRQEN